MQIKHLKQAPVFRKKSGSSFEEALSSSERITRDISNGISRHSSSKERPEKMDLLAGERRTSGTTGVRSRSTQSSTTRQFSQGTDNVPETGSPRSSTSTYLEHLKQREAERSSSTSKRRPSATRTTTSPRMVTESEHLSVRPSSASKSRPPASPSSRSGSQTRSGSATRPQGFGSASTSQQLQILRSKRSGSQSRENSQEREVRSGSAVRSAVAALDAVAIDRSGSNPRSSSNSRPRPEVTNISQPTTSSSRSSGYVAPSYITNRTGTATSPRSSSATRSMVASRIAATRQSNATRSSSSSRPAVTASTTSGNDSRSRGTTARTSRGSSSPRSTSATITARPSTGPATTGSSSSSSGGVDSRVNLGRRVARLKVEKMKLENRVLAEGPDILVDDGQVLIGDKIEAVSERISQIEGIMAQMDEQGGGDKVGRTSTTSASKVRTPLVRRTNMAGTARERPSISATREKPASTSATRRPSTTTSPRVPINGITRSASAQPSRPKPAVNRTTSASQRRTTGLASSSSSSTGTTATMTVEKRLEALSLKSPSKDGDAIGSLINRYDTSSPTPEQPNDNDTTPSHKTSKDDIPAPVVSPPLANSPPHEAPDSSKTTKDEIISPETKTYDNGSVLPNGADIPPPTPPNVKGMPPKRPIYIAEATRWKDDNKDGDYVDTDLEAKESAYNVPLSTLDMSDLKVIYGLGKGGFSAVMLVQRQSDYKLFALKVINKAMIREAKHRKRLQVERAILQKLEPSPFIAKLDVAFQTESELYFLMDYCAGGDLCYQCFRIFSKIDRFNDAQARFYISQIALAVIHLHKHGFVHRDIKPENIMMDETGHLKLIDFGLCKKIRTDAELSAMTKGDRSRMVPELESMSPCGSLAFVPPETLDQLGSFAGDWWGLGVIAFELLTGHFPWRNVGSDDDDALRAEIRSGKVDLPDFLSPLAASLLKGLLEKVVPRRLGYFTSNQIKSHPFFKGLDWDRASRREYDPPFHPCRPKKYRDSDGTTKIRPEPVQGIGNFGKDQRDLAMDHYCRNRRGESMNAATMNVVALPASLSADGIRVCKGKKPLISPSWPVFRGFDLAESRPKPGAPPTSPPPAKSKGGHYV